MNFKRLASKAYLVKDKRCIAKTVPPRRLVAGAFLLHHFPNISINWISGGLSPRIRPNLARWREGRALLLLSVPLVLLCQIVKFIPDEQFSHLHPSREVRGEFLFLPRIPGRLIWLTLTDEKVGEISRCLHAISRKYAKAPLSPKFWGRDSWHIAPVWRHLHKKRERKSEWVALSISRTSKCDSVQLS